LAKKSHVKINNVRVLTMGLNYVHNSIYIYIYISIKFAHNIIIYKYEQKNSMRRKIKQN